MKKKTKRKGKGLKDQKVAISQLTQRDLPKDVTNKIYRELSAITIQDSFNEKYLARIKKLLNIIRIRELEMFNNAFIHFIDSVNTTYEFDDKKTPGYLLNIKPNVETGIHQNNMLLELKRNPNSLKIMFKNVGYINLATIIITSIDNIRNSIVMIQNFKNIAIDDYRGAELGIETQPSIRNTTTRRVDSVIRRPRTMRAQAMKRKTRSI